MKITFSFYRFLLINSFKRKLWVFIGLLYIVFTFAFLVILPSFNHTDPLILWGNDLISPQSFLMIINVIIAALISINIFKNFIDNGTELLTFSKPLSRTNIILAKISALITVDLAFSLATIFVAFVSFWCNFINYDQMFSLALSFFITNFIFILFFSLFASIVSLYMNKIWTCLINIIFILIFVIFSTISTTTVYTPLQKVLDSGDFIQTNTKNLLQDKDGNYVWKNYSSFQNAAFPEMNTDGLTFGENIYGAQAPIFSIDSPGYNDFIFDIHNEKEIWSKAEKKSSVNVTNAFDFTKQFQKMYNGFELEELNNIDYMSQSFGFDRMNNYTIEKNFEKDLTDNNLTSIGYIETRYNGDWFNLMTNAGFSPMERLVAWLMCSYAYSYYYTIGAQNVKTNPSDMLLKSNDTSNYVGHTTYNGVYKNFDEKTAAADENESAIFSDVLAKIQEFINPTGGDSTFASLVNPEEKITSNTWYMTPFYPDFFTDKTKTYVIGSLPQSDDPWYSHTLDKKTSGDPFWADAPVIHNYFDLLHYLLCKEFDGDKININDEYLKFKFYAFNELCTQKGVDDLSLNSIKDTAMNDQTFFGFNVNNTTKPFESKGDILLPRGVGDDGYANYYNPADWSSCDNTADSNTFYSNPYVNPYFNNKGFLTSRALLDALGDSTGYVNNSNTSSSSSDNPAERKFNMCKLNIQGENLFVSAERTKFSYDVVPKISYAVFYCIWSTACVILGVVLLVCYNKRDFA